MQVWPRITPAFWIILMVMHRYPIVIGHDFDFFVAFDLIGRSSLNSGV